MRRADAENIVRRNDIHGNNYANNINTAANVRSHSIKETVDSFRDILVQREQNASIRKGFNIATWFLFVVAFLCGAIFIYQTTLANSNILHQPMNYSGRLCGTSSQTYDLKNFPVLFYPQIPNSNEISPSGICLKACPTNKEMLSNLTVNVPVVDSNKSSTKFPPSLSVSLLPSKVYASQRNPLSNICIPDDPKIFQALQDATAPKHSLMLLTASAASLYSMRWAILIIVAATIWTSFIFERFVLGNGTACVLSSYLGPLCLLISSAFVCVSVSIDLFFRKNTPTTHLVYDNSKYALSTSIFTLTFGLISALWSLILMFKTRKTEGQIRLGAELLKASGRVVNAHKSLLWTSLGSSIFQGIYFTIWLTIAIRLLALVVQEDAEEMNELDNPMIVKIHKKFAVTKSNVNPRFFFFFWIVSIMYAAYWIRLATKMIAAQFTARWYASPPSMPSNQHIAPSAAGDSSGYGLLVRYSAEGGDKMEDKFLMYDSTDKYFEHDYRKLDFNINGRNTMLRCLVDVLIYRSLAVTAAAGVSVLISPLKTAAETVYQLCCERTHRGYYELKENAIREMEDENANEEWEQNQWSYVKQSVSAASRTVKELVATVLPYAWPLVILKDSETIPYEGPVVHTLLEPIFKVRNDENILNAMNVRQIEKEMDKSVQDFGVFSRLPTLEGLIGSASHTAHSVALLPASISVLTFILYLFFSNTITNFETTQIDEQQIYTQARELIGIYAALLVIIIAAWEISTIQFGVRASVAESTAVYYIIDQLYTEKALRSESQYRKYDPLDYGYIVTNQRPYHLRALSKELLRQFEGNERVKDVIIDYLFSNSRKTFK